MFKKALLGLAAAGTVLGSTAAQAAVAPTQVQAARSDSSAANVENMAGGMFGAGASYGWLLLVAIAASVVAVAVTDDDDSPVSP